MVGDGGDENLSKILAVKDVRCGAQTTLGACAVADITGVAESRVES